MQPVVKKMVALQHAAHHSHARMLCHATKLYRSPGKAARKLKTSKPVEPAKQSNAAPYADDGELLAELNASSKVGSKSGSLGLRRGALRVPLYDEQNEEEDDWGLDDVAEHARNRTMRDGGSSLTAAPAISTFAGITTAGSLWLDPEDPTRVVVDEAYARHNPALVQSLKRLGKHALVKSGEEEWVDSDEQEDSRAAIHGIQQPDMPPTTGAFVEFDEFEPTTSSVSTNSTRAGSSSIVRGRSDSVHDQQDRPRRSAVADGLASDDDGGWMASLESAGFSMRARGNGDAYLERRSEPKRKVSKPAALAPAASQSEPARFAVQPATMQASSAVNSSPPVQSSGKIATAPRAQQQAPELVRSNLSPSLAVPSAASTSIASRQNAHPARSRAAPAMHAPQLTSPSAASGAAVAQPVQPSSHLRPKQQQPSPPPQLPGPTPGFTAALACVDSPEQVLALLEVVFPRWAADNFRLLPPRAPLGPQSSTADGASSASPAAAVAPGPADAAAALRRLATTARAQRRGAALRMSLAAAAHTLGLVECLRVTPPRTIHDGEPTSDGSGGGSGGGDSSKVATDAASAAAFAAARAYWLPPASGGVSVGGIGEPVVKAQAPSGAATASVTSKAAAGTGSSKKVWAASYQQALAKYAAPAITDDDGATVAAQGAAAAPSVPVKAAHVANRSGQTAAAERQRAVLDAIWALSVLGGPAYFAAEMEALLAVGRFGSSQLTPRAAAELLWSLGTARHWSARLEDIEGCIVQCGGLLTYAPHELSRLLWGFATLSYTPQRLLYTLPANWKLSSPAVWRGKASGRGAAGLSEYSTQDLASAGWSLAVMQQLDTAPFRSLWQELLSRGMEVQADGPITMTQVWQIAMAVQLESSWGGVASSTAAAAASCAVMPTAASPTPISITSHPAGISPAKRNNTAFEALASIKATSPLLVACEATFLAQTSALRQKVHSGYQRRIANTLTSMRQMHMLEDTSSGYAIDITLPALRIAIEADGPTHVARNAPRKALGATRMKSRHLRALGWSLVRVPFDEWDALLSEEARVAYLQARVDATLVKRIQVPAATSVSL